ncbi:MAG: 3-deoxy-manno-octulosonate cytidylyltransferase [Desulfohalobiaceae bacterium]
MDAPCIGIIPARYASSRFPGKPLARIQGRPMFWHVYARACKCPEIDHLYLATDHTRILQEAKRLGVPAILTSPEHHSGTDRVLEAGQALDLEQESILINIQGDEPVLDPGSLTQLLKPFSRSQVQASTLAREISQESAQDPNLVKVVLDQQGQALYFSRAAIPYPAGGMPARYLGHIGLYAYRLHVLQEFAALGPSSLEQTEKLEQLRLLQAGIPVQVSITRHESHAVDQPEDLEKIEAILAQEQQICRQY